MSTNVILKRSSVSGRVPTVGQIDLGEIAINTADGILYFKKDDGTPAIVKILEVTEDNLAIDSTGLNYSTSTVLSDVLDDLDDQIYALTSANHISSVTSDNTLVGDGTAGNALGVNYTELDPRYADTLQTVTDRSSVTTNEITVPSIIIGDYANNAGARLSWNAIDGTVDLAYDGVTLQVGQEQHFYAKATEAIANGEVVMFAGAQGDHLLIAKADQSAPGFQPEWIMGVATQDFALNDFGYVTTFGKVRGLDTSLLNEGDILYFDPDNAGQLTTTEPSAPDHIIQMAAVVYSHAINGAILVRPTHKVDTDEVQEGSTNLYYTDARARASISVTDNSSGSGSLTYNSTTGVLTFDGASTDYVDGLFSTVADELFAGIRTKFEYTATSGQTVFSGNDENGTSLVVRTDNLTDVFLNGVKLKENVDYSLDQDNNTVTLSVAANTGDLVDIVIFGNMTVHDSANVVITGGSITGVTELRTTGALVVDGTETEGVNTSVTGSGVISSLPISDFRTAKYLVQVTSGTEYHTTEILAIHDGTDVYLTEYGTIYTGSTPLATFSSEINTGNMLLTCSLRDATSDVKVYRTALGL